MAIISNIEPCTEPRIPRPSQTSQSAILGLPKKKKILKEICYGDQLILHLKTANLRWMQILWPKLQLQGDFVTARAYWDNFCVA